MFDNRIVQVLYVYFKHYEKRIEIPITFEILCIDIVNSTTSPIVGKVYVFQIRAHRYTEYL